MFRSLHKIGLATGAAVLASAATASGALAANPIVASVSGTTLTITDTTGVNQALIVSTNSPGYYNLKDGLSANAFVAGTGVAIAGTYSQNDVIISTGSATITRVLVRGADGADGVNAAGVTNVPVSLFGDGGNDILTAGAGADIVNGGDGDDVVRGGAGNDLLTGGFGSDSVYGQNGDDQIFDRDGYADTVDGGNDYDEFTRDAGLDTASNIELYK
ncbi:MAG: hypothetical protein PGN13_08115 [Patulibacter minatonensis]